MCGFEESGTLIFLERVDDIVIFCIPTSTRRKTSNIGPAEVQISSNLQNRYIYIFRQLQCESARIVRSDIEKMRVKIQFRSLFVLEVISLV